MYFLSSPPHNSAKQNSIITLTHYISQLNKSDSSHIIIDSFSPPIKNGKTRVICTSKSHRSNAIQCDCRKLVSRVVLLLCGGGVTSHTLAYTNSRATTRNGREQGERKSWWWSRKITNYSKEETGSKTDVAYKYLLWL